MTSEDNKLAVAPKVEARHITAAFVLAAIWAFLPELLLVNSELWAGIALATWAFGGLLHVNFTGFVVIAAAFGAAGLWVTYMTIRLAIANHEIT